MKSDNSLIKLDTSQVPWEKDAANAHMTLLQKLKEISSHLDHGRSIHIHGLPLLTQFTVAIVFMLAHSFSQVSISPILHKTINCSVYNTSAEMFSADKIFVSYVNYM